MAEDPSLHDVLPSNLQSAVDKKLTADEAALMTLAGANGEALVVTDRRVMIVREQMPIVAGETEVDCFDYPYEQIATVRVDGAVGGGHLNLILTTPPVDDKHVTLYFPPYDLSKFDLAAARIRLLAEQTRAVPVVPSAESPRVRTTPCPSCGEPIPAWANHCLNCGAAGGRYCGYCTRVIPSGALFCPSCGVSSEHARATTCVKCAAPLAGSFGYCPRCGQLASARCSECSAPALPGWSHCPHCGRRLADDTIVPMANLNPRQVIQQLGQQVGGAAEQHNANGMRLYNEEKYEEAIQEFEAALDADPGNPLFHCNLGVVYSEMGRDDDALEEYETAMRLAPTDPTPYLNLGYFHSERENEELARQSWNKVVDLAPGSPEAEEAKRNLEHADEV